MQAPTTQKSSQILLSLPNTTQLNQDYCYSITQTGSYFNPTQIQPLQADKPKQLYLQFELKPLESIRLNQHNQKSILNLVLGQIQIYVKVIKDPCYFIFEQGLYRNYVVIGLLVEGQHLGQIGRKEIMIGEWGKHVVAISHTIVLKDGKTKQLEECYPVLQIGDIKKQKVFESKIRNLKLCTTKSQPQYQKEQNKLKTFEIHEGPLDTIPTNPIPLLSTLPPYSSLPQKADKLYLCHDMAGGYIQDTNKHHPYPKATNKYKLDEAHQHTYRCLHLGQASIFNYFSHYLITIPPEHWRRICRTNRTLCLGTLIIEKQIPVEQDYLTQYMSDLLIFFCRKYKFDGYLINFQYAIKNVNKYLSPWLKKFVAALHEAVPNSRIIWYDSIIRNGKVSYQNQLNEHNEIFYKDTDGIFLNYWWNQQKLLRSLEHRVEGKIIYVGSDCFGRGTFGGGGYNTYKAINAIKKIDKGSGSLAPALFAMGYTYQNNKNNIEAWKIHEKSMYQGVGFFKQSLPHNKWQYMNSNINGFTWQIQDEWAITSFQNCTRHLTLKLQQIKSQMANSQNSSLSVTFFSTVAGTGPKFQDIYKIKLVLSIGGVVLNQVTTGQCHASEKQQIVQLKMDVDQDLIADGTDLIVVQEGHDIQKWGGHFGTRFKNDSIYFTSYSKTNDWIAQYKTNFPNGFPLPYLTNYNLGHGAHFHYKGKQITKNYDYMSDFDTNNAYIMNPPLNINIYYSDAYMGGTCLAIEQPKKIKLGEFQVQNQQRNILCRVVLKGVQGGQGGQGKNYVRIRYRFGQQTGMGCLSGSQILDNLWVCYMFSFDLGAFTQQYQKLVLFLQTDNSDKYLLGQTAIFAISQKQQICKITQLVLQLSQQNPPISPILFNVTLQTSTACRALLVLEQVDKNTPVFSAFAACDSLNNNTAIIKNMHGPAYRTNKLYVYCLNEQMQWKSIMSLDVDTKQLRCKGCIQLI